MSIAKAVITGTVNRTPEKRFTSNNLAIANFAINIDSGEDEQLLRVIAIGKNAEKAETFSKGTEVIVEGRLQTNVVKTTNGEEKKIVELSAQNIDVISSAGAAPSKAQVEEALFEEELADELIGEDEIPF